MRNASGYYDSTAYEAIKNIIESEKVNRMTINQGEIWEIKQNNGTYRNVIVLAVHDDVAQVLQLIDVGNSYSIEINCQGIKYTDPRKIQYTFNDTFTDFIRNLKTEEFDKIMNAVADCLGLSTHHTEEAVEPVDFQEELKNAMKKPVIEMTQDSIVFNQADTEELIKAKAERDIFKGLYEKLLADVMQK